MFSYIGDGAECRVGGDAQTHAGRRQPEAAHLQPIYAQDQVDTHSLNVLGGMQVQEWLSSTREGRRLDVEEGTSGHKGCPDSWILKSGEVGARLEWLKYPTRPSIGEGCMGRGREREGVSSCTSGTAWIPHRRRPHMDTGIGVSLV